MDIAAIKLIENLEEEKDKYNEEDVLLIFEKLADIRNKILYKNKKISDILEEHKNIQTDSDTTEQICSNITEELGSKEEIIIRIIEAISILDERLESNKLSPDEVSNTKSERKAAYEEFLKNKNSLIEFLNKILGITITIGQKIQRDIESLEVQSESSKQKADELELQGSKLETDIEDKSNELAKSLGKQKLKKSISEVTEMLSVGDAKPIAPELQAVSAFMDAGVARQTRNATASSSNAPLTPPPVAAVTQVALPVEPLPAPPMEPLSPTPVPPPMEPLSPTPVPPPMEPLSPTPVPPSMGPLSPTPKQVITSEPLINTSKTPKTVSRLPMTDEEANYTLQGGPSTSDNSGLPQLTADQAINVLQSTPVSDIVSKLRK